MCWFPRAANSTALTLSQFWRPKVLMPGVPAAMLPVTDRSREEPFLPRPAAGSSQCPWLAAASVQPTLCVLWLSPPPHTPSRSYKDARCPGQLGCQTRCYRVVAYAAEVFFLTVLDSAVGCWLRLVLVRELCLACKWLLFYRILRQAFLDVYTPKERQKDYFSSSSSKITSSIGSRAHPYNLLKALSLNSHTGVRISPYEV